MPDSVVRAAGEVELVDVAPEALRDRLARGHIYPADQAEAALGGWFQAGNLSALRELALLWLAAALASGPRQYLRGGGDPGSGQARERVVVALSGGPEGEMLIRRAARIAARSGGDLLAVHAARPGRPARSGRAGLAAQRRLAESAAAPTTSSPTRTSRRRCWPSPTRTTPPSWCLAPPPAPGGPRCGPPASDRGSSATAADSTCTSSPAQPPPTASRPRHVNHQRRRPVMTQQNAPWPGRMRPAARWGGGERLGGTVKSCCSPRRSVHGERAFAGTNMLCAGTGGAQAAWHGGAAGQAEGMSVIISVLYCR